MKGFFPESLVVGKQRESSIPKCGACGLFKKCKSPKIPVAGKGRLKILIVGEAPGKTEDFRNAPFVGDSGKLLRAHLKQIGINPDRDCWMTNAIICRPTNNRTPNNKEIEYCRPNIVKAINELDPVVIITLGFVAAKSVLSWAWEGNDIDSIGKWAGWTIPFRKNNVWICPTYHPSFLLREKSKAPKVLFKKHLQAALQKSASRPYKEIPNDPKDFLEIIYNPSEAAPFIRQLTKNGGEAAFDYETNTLKPDREKARIVSCSISWEGKVTIAYPWHGEAIQATKEFLFSKKINKIAANMKFEERWTIAEFGRGVSCWSWDTIIFAHCLNNISATGLKFLSFVMLGHPIYDNHIKPYLESSKGYYNRVDEIDLKQLLQYNALDSLLEFQIADIQKGCLV